MANMHRAVSAACAGPGRGADAGVPHPKRPRKDSHSLPSGWPFGGCRFVVFLPRLAASRHREQTSRTAPRGGVLGGGAFLGCWGLHPSRGQVAVAGSGQCASREADNKQKRRRCWMVPVLVRASAAAVKEDDIS